MVGLCDNVANVGTAGERACGWWGADSGSVAFALRCRCLRARSGPADGCRGRGRRCRSRFQRFRCERHGHQPQRSTGRKSHGDRRHGHHGRERQDAHGHHGQRQTAGTGASRTSRPAGTDTRTERQTQAGTDTTDEKKDRHRHHGREARRPRHHGREASLHGHHGREPGRHGHHGRDARLGRRRRGSRSGRAAAPDPVAAPAPDAAARRPPIRWRRRPPIAVAPAPDPAAAPAPDAAVAPAPDAAVAPAPDAVAAPAPDAVAPAPDAAVAPAPDAVAPVTPAAGATSVAGRSAPNVVGADGSDVSALIQDMLTSVAGAVVPLTQLQSDLYSFLVWVSDVIALIQGMLTSVAGAVVPLTQLQSDLYSFLVGIAGMDPVVAAVTLPGSSPFGRRRRCWAVASRGCVGGVAMAAGPAICRYPGRAVGRQRNRGCTARGDCGVHFRRDDPGRSSVIAARDGTVVFPACLQRTPAIRVTGGAGRCRSARRRRAYGP